MALPSSGSISLNQMHIEVGGSSGSQVSLNDSDVRGLISKNSASQMSFNEWYGATSFTADNSANGWTSASVGYTLFKTDTAERGFSVFGSNFPNNNFGSRSGDTYFEMASGKKIYIGKCHATQTGSTSWNTSTATAFFCTLPIQSGTYNGNSIYGLGTSNWSQGGQNLIMDNNRLSAAGLLNKKIYINGNDINCTINRNSVSSASVAILTMEDGYFGATDSTGSDAANVSWTNDPENPTPSSNAREIGLSWSTSTSNSNRQNFPSSGTITITLV